MAAQEQEPGVFFDTVITCSVTGSTQAGMIAGFALQETEGKVLGIDGSATVEQTWKQIDRIARQTADAIGLGRELRDDEIVLLDEWHAGTYGIPDAKTIEAIRLCARLEGVLTDPVYEGKSMAALIDLVRSERIPSGSRVLYAHLGGQPALNAYAGSSENPTGFADARSTFDIPRDSPADSASRGYEEAFVACSQPLAIWFPLILARDVDRVSVEGLEQFKHRPIFVLEQSLRHTNLVVR